DQTRTITEQAIRIDKLVKENETLRKELDQRVSAAADTKQATTKSSVPDVDVQQLFQKNVEAQAEIDLLKKKLRAYKAKAHYRLQTPLSSPLVSSSVPVPSSPEKAQASRLVDRLSTSSAVAPVAAVGECLENPKNVLEDTTVRSQDTPTVLKDTSSNRKPPSANSAEHRSRKKTRAQLISEFAEDGENHVPIHEQHSVNDHSGVVSRDHRLSTLLETPSGSRSTLRASIVPDHSHVESAQRPSTRARISNIDHSLTTQIVNVPIPALSRSSSRKTQRTSGNTFSVTLDENSLLRSRPVEKLSLLSFKPNPKWLHTHQMTYTDLIRGKEGERIKRLVDTLPQVPGQGMHEKPLTDHQLLVEFLGHGSESKIADLTPVARQNLLLEARTKRVAQAFAKKTSHFDRELDPPGFWDVDMPGTQEEEDNRKAAKLQEREEVKCRYEDAMRGEGKWVFIDE
ncbi:hypothetical protein LTR66_016667, partial [Elasticomyces elasticus]